jgi:hypothetical protein
LIEEPLTIDETTPSTDVSDVPQAGQLRHHPAHRTVGHTGGRRDLPIGSRHELWPGEQRKQHLEPGRLEGASTFRRRYSFGRTLAFDEYQKGRLVEERVAGRIDELDAPRSQRIRQRGRDVICNQEPVTGASPELMHQRTDHCWPEPSLHLRGVPELAAGEVQADRRVSPVLKRAGLLVHQLELQPKGRHGAHGAGQQILSGLPDVVHRFLLSTCRGHISIVDMDWVRGDQMWRSRRNRQPPGRKSFGHRAGGRAVFPWPVWFIGGNHEPYGFLDTMPEGGTVAPNCHYLGRAGRVELGGLQIVGLSGIFSPSRLAGRPPVSEIARTKKKLYTYFTEEDVSRALVAGPADVLVVHDWPRGAVDPADHPELVGKRRYSLPDGPGNEYARLLVDLLQPRLVLAGHLHWSYRSWMSHRTRFAALGHIDTGRDAFGVFRVDPAGTIVEIAE